VKHQNFDKNFAIWSHRYPEVSQELPEELTNVKRIRQNGFENLSRSYGEETVYYHNPQDPLKEAQEWFASLNLRGIKVLYVYGIGLGYYYEAVKEWLKKEDHYLVFLENDAEVLRAFLETERAIDLLSNEKVFFHFFQDCNPGNPKWQELFKIFGNKSFLVSALGIYAKANETTFIQLQSIIPFWSYFHETNYSERISLGYMFFKNYYQNLFQLPQAYQSKDLFEKFKGVPAIICGAGPSLDKNLAVLETLGERALIFAGGSSMNAVNSRGFIPHFGIGIDPNPAQVTRLFMNEAYEVPFLYRNRLQAESLRTVQGPKLYVTGTSGYQISDWVEKELGIEGKNVEEGLNVVNFSLSLACELGCNPIIFVGLDLAYSEQKSYQSGVISHPLHSRRQFFSTKRSDEDLLLTVDIFGNPTFTLWKWISESLWLAQFVNKHPNTLFINATEGGIGIPEVPNKSLEEVKHFLLQREFALRERVHGEIQNAQMPAEVTKENIIRLLTKLRESLFRCEKNLEFLLQAPRTEIRDQLEKEIAYQYILKDFNEYFEPSVMDVRTLNAQFFLEDVNSKKRQEDLDKKRLKLIYDTAMVNRTLIEEIVFKQQQQTTTSPKAPSLDALESGFYELNEEELIISDPDLHLSIREKIPADESFQRESILYPDGRVKFEQNTLLEKLHGPVTFFKEDGMILAKSWYVNGLQQGKSHLYYLSGAMYAVEGFVDGKRHGVQRYYYPDGAAKTVLHYDHGKLHGEVQLTYPSGKPKRELHFLHGKRHGIERMWDELGLLIVDVEYREGLPIGHARMWHPSGQLAQEVVFNEDSKLVQIDRWNEFGEKIHDSEGDYFDQVSKHTLALTKSLEDVWRALSHVAPLLGLSKEKQASIEKELQELSAALQALHGLNEELLKTVGLQGDEILEPIWKTPSMQRELEQQIELVTAKLREELQRIQNLVKEAKERMKDERKG